MTVARGSTDRTLLCRGHPAQRNHDVGARWAPIGASPLRSDERVEHDLPDLLWAAAGHGELGGPLQCLGA